MPRPEPKHGTRSRYIRYNCRCTDCVQANRTYQRAWAAAKRARVRAERLGESIPAPRRASSDG